MPKDMLLATISAVVAKSRAARLVPLLTEPDPAGSARPRETRGGEPPPGKWAVFERRGAGARSHAPATVQAARRLNRAAGTLARAHDRQVAGIETCEKIRDAVQTVDAHCLEVGTEHGLNGALPALLDPQLLREPRPAVESLRLEPLSNPAGGFAKRCLLECLRRHLLALRLLQPDAKRIERLTQLALMFARC